MALELESKNYDGGVDYGFLKAMGVTVVRYQPWQLGLFYPDLAGKFIWYPRKGTLMYEYKEKNVLYKIGNTGDFIAGGFRVWWDKDATEKVWHQIIKKVKK